MVRETIGKSFESLSQSLDVRLEQFSKRFSNESASAVDEAFKRSKRET